MSKQHRVVLVYSVYRHPLPLFLPFPVSVWRVRQQNLSMFTSHILFLPHSGGPCVHQNTIPNHNSWPALTAIAL